MEDQGLANKRHKPEEIVTKLQQVDVFLGRGMARVDAIREVPKRSMPTIA
jgi:hypothetical protein